MNSWYWRDWILFAASMRKVEKLFLIAIVVFFVLPLKAQNGTLTPYSRYGIGQLAEQSVGINKAMGGIGIGLRERNTLNIANPASYSTVDTLTFLFDFGFSLSNCNFQENGVRLNARNASVDYIAMQFRIVRNLGFTMSLMPVSNTGYSFSETSVIRSDEDGNLTATNSYGGEGGLRKVAAGLGWAPFKWLSAGVDAGYVFGDITHIITNRYNESTVFTKNKAYYASMRGLNLDFGLQTGFNAGKGKLTLGLVYSPMTALNDDTYILDQIINSSSVEEVSDTVRMSNAFALPEKFGAGLTYSHEKWLAGADVSYERWGGSGLFFGESGRDRIKVSLGGMYQPERNHRNLFRRSSYRAGLFYSQPYFNVGNMAGPVEYGASAGISLPIINHWNNLIEINISGQYVHCKPSAAGQITEDYLRLSIGLAFNERWFTKWKVE